MFGWLRARRGRAAADAAIVKGEEARLGGDRDALVHRVRGGRRSRGRREIRARDRRLASRIKKGVFIPTSLSFLLQIPTSLSFLLQIPTYLSFLLQIPTFYPSFFHPRWSLPAARLSLGSKKGNKCAAKKKGEGTHPSNPSASNFDPSRG